MNWLGNATLYIVVFSKSIVNLYILSFFQREGRKVCQEKKEIFARFAFFAVRSLTLRKPFPLHVR